MGSLGNLNKHYLCCLQIRDSVDGYMRLHLAAVTLIQELLPWIASAKYDSSMEYYSDMDSLGFYEGK